MFTLPDPFQRHDSRPATIRSTIRLLFILDKSRSMADSESQVTKALLGFVTTLQNPPGQLRYLATLVCFAHEPETIVVDQPLEQLAVEYKADGEGTALFDALAHALPLERSRDEMIICVIISDGQENSSKEANERQVAAMVSARRELGNWRFLWLSLDGKPNRTARAMSIECLTARREDISQALTQLAERIGRMATRLTGSAPLRAIEGGRR
jgi:Mg-chelatase subunit ChlD